jgi:protein TonB
VDDLRERFSLSRPEDRRIMPVAFCVALCIHLACMFISFPDAEIIKPEPKAHKAIVIQRYVPPPPEPDHRRSSARRTDAKRKIPIPDPTPDDPEPIVEPRPDLPLEPFPEEGEFLVGDPAPPSAYDHGAAGSSGRGPVLAGVGNVTNPVRIDESYVRPCYPEMARASRVEGQVILKAVILRDGSVTEPQVMRCCPPGFGFAEAAIAAIEQWRYRPATQDGKPVACYFTIVVDFDLV